MIIGIDVSAIPYGTGVSNYTSNLVRNLVLIDHKNQYKLFFSSLRQPLPLEISELIKYKNVTIYHHYLPPTLLSYLWNDLHILPIEMFIGRCDVFHTWDWTHPPTTKAKTITTVHDFVPFLFPEDQHPRTIATFKKKLSHAARECLHFICVSQSTKDDLTRIFPGISLDKISVIYEAAEKKFDQFHKLSLKDRQQKIAKIHQQYGLSNFILTQGTREPRKNLHRLIKAFTLFKKEHPTSKVELAISGKYGWGEDVSPPGDNSVKVLGYIPEKDLVALHASALCLAYPSTYEGFGLPIIKSMKVGTPVITSNLSSLAEVAGLAALLVNPTSTKELTDAITKIVNSPTLRRTLINRGYRQAAKFSWTKTASQTLAIYEKVASQ
ncbi:glycosyltransferase family 4 protein [Candidatus Shapirobacteria bacterium]|nr:glycosyltransferase family 4 protein [Candidatus Shapirobacteria bacterium]